MQLPPHGCVQLNAAKQGILVIQENEMGEEAVLSPAELGSLLHIYTREAKIKP